MSWQYKLVRCKPPQIKHWHFFSAPSGQIWCWGQKKLALFRGSLLFSLGGWLALFRGSLQIVGQHYYMAEMSLQLAQRLGLISAKLFFCTIATKPFQFRGLLELANEPGTPTALCKGMAIVNPGSKARSLFCPSPRSKYVAQHYSQSVMLRPGHYNCDQAHGVAAHDGFRAGDAWDKGEAFGEQAGARQGGRQAPILRAEVQITHLGGL